MGFKYIDAAISAQLPGKPTETLGRKAILVAICWYANNKTGLCWPSWSQLAARAQCSRKTAKTHALDLINLGLVVVKGEHSTPKGPVKLLWVNLNRLRQLAGLDEVEDATEPDGVSAGTESGDAESFLDCLEPASTDPNATVGDFDQGSSDPAPRVASTPVPGLDLPPTRVVATPKPGIDLEFQPGIQTWKKKATERVDSHKTEISPNPNQTRKSTTRDSVPNPAGDFSPPEPPGSPVSPIGDSPRSAAPRSQEPKPAAPRCRKCDGPVKNNKIDGVCLKCGFDPNHRETPFVEFEDRGRHKWPTLKERTSDSLCLNGCGTSFGESKYLRDSRHCWKADGAND